MKTKCTVAGVVAALTLAGCGTPADPPAASATPDEPASTTSSSAPAAGRGPVWWDAAGLHHGAAVEETAVRLGDPDKGGVTRPRLALVRTGALYWSPETGDIWFHPWGGRPRVVGRGTTTGPGGDPEGDVAAWFDGWHLVVYDTSRHEVISRTLEVAGVHHQAESAEHVGHGNGWVHVSSSQVVWRSPDGLARRDLAAGKSEPAWLPQPSSPRSPGRPPHSGAEGFVDVSETSAVWAVGNPHEGRGTFLVDRAGARQTRHVPDLEYPGRLSPDGSWLMTAELADGTHGVAIIDLRSGEIWKPFKEDTYAFYSWAYDDVAVMMTKPQVARSDAWELVACYAAEQRCERLPSKGGITGVVLPNP